MEKDRIIKVEYEDEMKKSYIDYAMSVIVQRAIPDVRDGFKPVHRRILYGMDGLHLEPDKPHKKSARIVGEVMGKYHPHGDFSIYEAMVRMSQDYSMGEPLVDGHGNFGSIDGDSAAAMRYTEARLSKMGAEMLKDLDKGIVDYMDNFDSTLKEPIVLPATFPNLLVNGTTGIAVGMRTDIPPHNLGETIDACRALLDNEKLEVEKLMNFIQGPDFPTGGTIVNGNELLDIYKTGTGKIRVRAKMEQESLKGGRVNLVVTEIPFSASGSKSRLVESLIEMVRDRKLDEVVEVRDESSKDGIRIVLEVKKGIDIENLQNKLFSKTKLEDTVSVNFLAIVDNRPEVLNLKEVLTHFLNFQKDINKRKYTHLLEKSLKKEEILSGLIKAQDIIDLIIEILRGSKDIKMAKECLVNGNTSEINFKTKKAQIEASKLSFTQVQADAILEMKLHKLIGLELKKLQEELDNLLKDISYFRKILGDEKELKKVIKSDLLRIKKSYSRERKTEIVAEEKKKYIEETIVEDLYVLIDRFGYTKSVDSQTYNRCNPETLLEFKKIIPIKSDDKLYIFTEDGKLHQIKALDIPKGKIKDKGALIDTISSVGKSEVVAIEVFSNIRDSKLLILTEEGFIKLVNGTEYDMNRKTALYTKLGAGDKVINVTPLNKEGVESGCIIITTQEEKALKFKIKDIPEQKKMAVGAIGVKLNKGDRVKMAYIEKDEPVSILLGKRKISSENLKLRKRAQRPAEEL